MSPESLTELIDATWPAASFSQVGQWTIREGAGGGSRVSAATLTGGAGGGPASPVLDIVAAEAAMASLGQAPLFMVRHGEDSLDASLAARGYEIRNPVTVYEAPVAALAATPPPPMSCIDAWPPLAIMAEIWADGGIGPSRLAVMARVRGPKTALLGRDGDRPAGVLFAAAHAGTAMIHAIEVRPRFRRRGVARNLLRRAACWAEEAGCTRLTLLVTAANPAAPLYGGLGMEPAAAYHYRFKELTVL